MLKQNFSFQVIEHSWTHKFFTKLLPLLLALFFVYLAYCYMGMQANPQDVTKKVDPFLQNVEQDPGKSRNPEILL